MSLSSSLAPYFFALGANLVFSWATVAWTHFSHRFSPLWMNAFKAIVAFIAFTIVYLLSGPTRPPDSFSLFMLFISGFLGLGIGDWLLMKAFVALGASRTLMMYGFQPLFLGIASYFLFNQTVEPSRLVAIIFLVACLFTFSLENFKKKGHWEVMALAVGLAAITLDGAGVLFTRYVFDHNPQLTSVDSNFFRTIGAVLFFGIISFKYPIRLYDGFKSLEKNRKILLVASSLSGTFLSLLLYLTAIQKGNLAVVSGIAITSPLFAGIVESAVHRHRPSRYLVAAFLLFAIGFSILVF